MTQVALPWSSGSSSGSRNGAPFGPDITVAEATEWLVVVHIGLLALEMPSDRSRDERLAFLRTFVAYPLLSPRATNLSTSAPATPSDPRPSRHG